MSPDAKRKLKVACRKKMLLYKLPKELPSSPSSCSSSSSSSSRTDGATDEGDEGDASLSEGDADEVKEERKVVEGEATNEGEDNVLEESVQESTSEEEQKTATEIGDKTPPSPPTAAEKLVAEELAADKEKAAAL
jgi:hypothetical protein